ncbi:MAG: 4-hydroxybenzoate octaprenyltransferase, partial [Gemmataceae bacterium]
TGLFSLPSRMGARNALRLAGLSHGIMVGLLALLPWAEPKMGGIYWAGLAMVALILCYEHSLVRPGELKRVEMAFFWMNIAVSLGLWLVICFQLAWVRVHDG